MLFLLAPSLAPASLFREDGALPPTPSRPTDPPSTTAQRTAADSATANLLLFRVDNLRALSSSERKRAFSQYVEAVRSALDSGDHPRALLLAQKATTLWQAWRRPLLHRSAALLGTQKWGPAIESAREARRARDDALEPRTRPDETAAAADYWEGVALYRTQRYDEALPHLRAAAENSPEWAEAFRALGEASFVDGHADEAASAYARATELAPRIGSARDMAYFAAAKRQHGDLEGAIGILQEALRRYPYSPGLHANLASMLRQEGSAVEAYYHFTLELLLHGTDGPFAREALQAAGEVLQEVENQAKHPGRRELLLVSTGLDHLRADRAHRAAHAFEEVVRTTRTSTGLPQLLHAEALLRSGDATRARVELERLLDQEPDFVPALALLADVLRALGEGEQAQLTFRRAQELFPAYPKLRAGAKSG